MQRIVQCLTLTALATLFATAFWLRVSSIESMPYPDGDEAWYGIQAEQMLAGKPPAFLTPTGNPLNPLYTGMELPLLSVFRPALWILRVPSVVCGILAVILSFVLLSRVFDRTTGLIAATLMATLPVTILFSRIGFDASQTPLFSLIAVFYAFRGNILAVLISFIACLLIHPTNLFLAPVLLAVLAVKTIEHTSGNPRKRFWSLGALIIVPGLAVAAFGIYTLNRPGTQTTYATAFQGLDWPRFATLVGRMFLGLGQFPISNSLLSLHDWAFRGAVLGAFCLGSIPLLRSKRWDVVAMIAGLLVSLVAFHVVAGRDAIRTQWISYLRYGLFAVVPGVIAISCLTRHLLVKPNSPRRLVLRDLQNLTLLIVPALLLLSVKNCWFDRFAAAGYESVWSFRTDAKDPHRQIVSSLSHDRIAAQPVKVFAQDQWVQRPICFLAGSGSDVNVVNLDEMARTPAKICEALREPLTAGAYAVGPVGGVVDQAMGQLFPPDAFRTWAGTMNGNTYLVLYRLKRPDEIQGLAKREKPASKQD